MDLIYRFDPYQPLERPAYADPDAAQEALRLGNERFVGVAREVRKVALGESGEHPIVIPTNPLAMGLPIWGEEAVTQTPFALVLGCADARVPVEVIFDQAVNALFVVRIAGNVLGAECLGSVDYALKHLSKNLKLVVVLGHRGCGAVSAAVDTYLAPHHYAHIAFTHSLRTLLDRLQLPVRGAARTMEQYLGEGAAHRPNYTAALKELAVYINAALTAYDLRREVDLVAGGAVRVVYGVFDLVSQRVSATPQVDAGPTFREAPNHPDEFTSLAEQLLGAVFQKGLLG